MNFLSRLALVVSLFMGGFSPVITAMEKPNPPGQKGAAAKQSAQAGQPVQKIPMLQRNIPHAKKFEFSNQSDQFALVLIPIAINCLYPIALRPNDDSGILNPMEGGRIHVLTKGGYFLMQVNREGSFRVSRQGSDRPMEPVNVASMPYNEVQDVVVVINPDGSLNFSKRRP